MLSSSLPSSFEGSSSWTVDDDDDDDDDAGFPSVVAAVAGYLCAP